MKKKIICIILMLTITVCILCGCKNYKGYDFIDTHYHFDRAIIRMPDDSVIEVEIAKWKDAEGEQLTITTKDGKRYLVSSINCILIEDDVK